MSEEQIAHYTDKIHTPVRKLAHMSEYFVLAVCVSFPLYVYGLRGILLILFAGLISVGFACPDEFHQSSRHSSADSGRHPRREALPPLPPHFSPEVCHPAGFSLPPHFLSVSRTLPAHVFRALYFL